MLRKLFIDNDLFEHGFTNTMVTNNYKFHWCVSGHVIVSHHQLCKQLILRTCMKTECVISGTTGGLMDPNYCYKNS